MVFASMLPAETPVGPSTDRATGLAEVARRVSPTVLAVDRTLPVAPALAGLLPGGLRRGTTVGISGVGARSLALALLSAATVTGSWAAVVGDRDLGLASAAEAGVDLQRLAVVDPPPPGVWGEVVAALVAALDLVLVAPGYRVSGIVVRRLTARCRERGSVLIRVGDDPWPDRCDLRLTVLTGTWSGPDDGHGRLRSRLVEVVADGRGVAAGSRRSELFLPGPDGAASDAG